LNQELPTVLVIEDEEVIQGVIEDALTDAGFSPAIAASGEEAVTLLNGCGDKYRALVTDVGLRGKMDGWAVARRARQIDPEFPVVYRRARGPMGITGRAQQYPFGKAVCTSAARDRCFSAS